MIKRFCICTCVPAKKDSQHKDIFLSNGFFFKFTPVITNLGQGPRNLWAEWVIAPPIIPSFFVLFCLFYDSLLIFMLKAKTISFIKCMFFAGNQRSGDKSWIKSVSELVEINASFHRFPWKHFSPPKKKKNRLIAGQIPLDKLALKVAFVLSRSVKKCYLQINMPVQRLFFVLFRFIKESLLFEPNPQKSCKVLEREKKYHSSTYSNIMKNNTW